MLRIQEVHRQNRHGKQKRRSVTVFFVLVGIIGLKNLVLR